MAAISKAWVTIADTAVDPDSPGDTTLMTGIRDDLVHLREWLGASFTGGAVQDHNHDGVNSALIEVGPNLLRNGSYEQDGVGWTITDYSGGSHAFSTSTRHHGAKSLAFTSTVLANGGGDALNNEFIPVAGLEWYEWTAQISTSAGNISSRISVVWYDAAQSQISEITVYDSTSTPTAKTALGRGLQAPSTARYGKIRVKGGVPGAGSATGTIFFDDVQFRVAGNRVLIDEQEASSSTSLDFTTGIDDTFGHHELEIERFIPATNNVELGLRMDTDGGASFDAGASDYAFANQGLSTGGTNSPRSSSGANGILLNNLGTISNDTSRGYNGVVKLFGLASSLNKYTTHQAAYHNSTPAFEYVGGAGFTNSATLNTNPVDALRLYMTSGNIASGKARLFGIRKR